MNIANTLSVQDFTKTFGSCNDGNLMLDEKNRLVRINRGQSGFTRFFIYKQHAYTRDMDRRIREALLAAVSRDFNCRAVTEYARKRLGLDGDQTGEFVPLLRRDIKNIIDDIKMKAPEFKREVDDKFQQFLDIGRDGKGFSGEEGFEHPTRKGKDFLELQIFPKVDFKGGKPEDYAVGPLYLRILREVQTIYRDCAPLIAMIKTDYQKEVAVRRMYAAAIEAAQQFVDRLNEYQVKYQTALRDCATAWDQAHPGLKAALDEFVDVQPKIWTETELCDLTLDGTFDFEFADEDLSPQALANAGKPTGKADVNAEKSDGKVVKDFIVGKYKVFAEFKGAVEDDAENFANMTGETSKAWYDNLAGRLFEKAVKADASGQFLSRATLLGFGTDDLKAWFVADMGQRLADRVAHLMEPNGLTSAAKVELVAEYLEKGSGSFQALSEVLRAAVSPVNLGLGDVFVGKSLSVDEIEKIRQGVETEVRNEVAGLMQKFLGKQATLDATVSAIRSCVNGAQGRFEAMIDACVRLVDRQRKIVGKIKTAFGEKVGELRNDKENKGLGRKIDALCAKVLNGDSIQKAVRSQLHGIIVAYAQDPKGKPLPMSDQDVDKTFCAHQTNRLVNEVKLALAPLRERIKETRQFLSRCDRIRRDVDYFVKSCQGEEVEYRLIAAMEDREKNDPNLYGILGLTRKESLGSSLHERCSVKVLIPQLLQQIKVEAEYLKNVCDKACGDGVTTDETLLNDEFERRREAFCKSDFIIKAVDSALDAWQQSKKVYEEAFKQVEKRLIRGLAGARNLELCANQTGMTNEQQTKAYEFSFAKFFSDNGCLMSEKANAYRVDPSYKVGESALIELVLSTLQRLQDMAFGIGSEKAASDVETIVKTLDKKISEGILAANRAKLGEGAGNVQTLDFIAKMMTKVVGDAVDDRIATLGKDISDLKKSGKPEDLEMANRLEVRKGWLPIMLADEMRGLLVKRFMASFKAMAEDAETYHVRTELKDDVNILIGKCVQFYYGSDDRDDPSLAVRIQRRLLDRGSPDLIEGEKIEGEKIEVKTDWFYSYSNEKGTVRDRVDAFKLAALRDFVGDPEFDVEAFYADKLPQFVDALIQEVQSEEHAKEREALRTGIENARTTMTQAATVQIGARRLGEGTGLFASKSPFPFTLGEVFAGTDELSKMVGKAVADLEAKMLKGILHDGDKYVGRIGMTTFAKFSEKAFVADVVKALGENPTVKALVQRAKDNLAEVNAFCADHRCEHLKKTFAREIQACLVEDLKAQLADGSLLKPKPEKPRESVLERVVRRRNEKSPFAEAVTTAAKSDYNDYVADVKTGNGHRLIEGAVDELLKELSSMKSEKRRIALRMPDGLRMTLIQRYEKIILDRADERFGRLEAELDDEMSKNPKLDKASRKAKARTFDWKTDGEQLVKGANLEAKSAVRAALQVLDGAYDHIDGYNAKVSGKGLKLVDPLFAKREARKRVESETLATFLSNTRRTANYLDSPETKVTIDGDFAKWVDDMLVTKGLLGDLQADAPVVWDLCQQLFVNKDLSTVYEGKRLSDVKEILDVLANTVKLNVNQPWLGVGDGAMGNVVCSMIPGVLARARRIQPEGVLSLQTVWQAFFGPKAKMPAAGTGLLAAFVKAVDNMTYRALPKTRTGLLSTDVSAPTKTAFLEACRTGLRYEAALKQAADPSRMVGAGEVISERQPLGLSGDRLKHFVDDALGETFLKAVADARGADYANLSAQEKVRRDQEAKKLVTAKYLESLVTEQEFNEACKTEMIKRLAQDLQYDLENGLSRGIIVGNTQYFTTADLVEPARRAGIDLRQELTTRLENAYQGLLSESSLKGTLKPRQLIQALSLISRTRSGTYFRAYQDAFATGESLLVLSIPGTGDLVARLEHENKPTDGKTPVTRSDLQVEISPAGEVRLKAHTAMNGKQILSYV